jgi:hypothetical protein
MGRPLPALAFLSYGLAGERAATANARVFSGYKSMDRPDRHIGRAHGRRFCAFGSDVAAILRPFQ